MKKRLLLVILAAILLFGMVGCFGNTKETTEPVSQSQYYSPVHVATEPLEITTETVPTTDLPISEETIIEPTTEISPETKPIPIRTADSTFDIYFLDVDQGDAACVICDGEAMLIDGGNKSKSSLIYSFLQSHNITHLTYIVATHPDSDHVGGLSGALNYATVGAAFCTVTDYDTEPFQDFIRYLGKRNCTITVPSPGDEFYLGCAHVTILYPEPSVTKTDNTSLTLHIEYGDTSFLFTGDCETDDETELLSSGFNLRSDVLKVAHHGSRYSTSGRFLNAVQPSYAVISVGGGNTYGHPTEEVLSNLKSHGVILFRTDINGDVHCSSDGSTVTFDIERNADIDTYLAAGGYKNYLEQLATQETDPVPDRTLPGEDMSEETSETEPKVTYIANTNTHKFHFPSCSSVDSMKESNKWYFTGTRDELIEMGYEPCKRCNP